MIKDISQVQTQKPVLGKLALLRQMQGRATQLEIGLSAFSERIARRVLRRDLRAWKRFSLEYRMEPEQAAQTAQPAVENNSLALDVLFQIYADAQRPAALAPALSQELERIVERRLFLLQPERIAARHRLGAAARPGALFAKERPAEERPQAPQARFASQPAFRELLRLERESRLRETERAAASRPEGERPGPFVHTLERLLLEQRLEREGQGAGTRPERAGAATGSARPRPIPAAREGRALAADRPRPAAATASRVRRPSQVQVPQQRHGGAAAAERAETAAPKPLLQAVLERRWTQRERLFTLERRLGTGGAAALGPAAQPAGGDGRGRLPIETGAQPQGAAGQPAAGTSDRPGGQALLPTAATASPASAGRERRTTVLREMRSLVRLAEGAQALPPKEAGAQQALRLQVERLRDFARTQLVHVREGAQADGQEPLLGAGQAGRTGTPAEKSLQAQRRLAQAAAGAMARALRRYGLTRLELLGERGPAGASGERGAEGREAQARRPEAGTQAGRSGGQMAQERALERTLERRVLERALWQRTRTMAARLEAAAEGREAPAGKTEIGAGGPSGEGRGRPGIGPMTGWLLREAQGRPGEGRLTEREKTVERVEALRRYGLTRLELLGQRGPAGASGERGAQGREAQARRPEAGAQAGQIGGQGARERALERTLERRVLERALWQRTRTMAARPEASAPGREAPVGETETGASGPSGEGRGRQGIGPMTGWLLREAQGRPGEGRRTEREKTVERVEALRRYGLTRLELLGQRGPAGASGERGAQGREAQARRPEAGTQTGRSGGQMAQERTLERTLERRVLERALWQRTRTMAARPEAAAEGREEPAGEREIGASGPSGEGRGRPAIGPMTGWLLREAQGRPGEGRRTEREKTVERVEALRRYGLTRLELLGQRGPAGANGEQGAQGRFQGPESGLGGAAERAAREARRLTEAAARRQERLWRGLAPRLEVSGPTGGRRPGRNAAETGGQPWRGRDAGTLTLLAGQASPPAGGQAAAPAPANAPAPAPRQASGVQTQTRIRELLLRSLRTVERREARLRRPALFAPRRTAAGPLHHRLLPQLHTAVEGQATMTQAARARGQSVQRTVLETIALAGEAASPLRSSILTTPAEIVMFVPPTFMNAYGAPPARVGNLSWEEDASQAAGRNGAKAALDLMRKAQQSFGQAARYRPPEMVMKEQGSVTGRLASQQAGQPRSINQEIQARKKAVERVQAQELSSAEINRIVDRVYDKLERKIATEYRRRGL